MILTSWIRHLTLADQAADRYPQIAFEVEAGTPSFEVTLDVGGTADPGGAGIDLGCEGPQGWRGWSGGARTSFVIDEGDATPGYAPGPLKAGRWAVVLGLHRIPADGVDVTVTVESPAPHRPDHGPVEDPVAGVRRGSSRGLPAPDGMTWYAGDLHTHSLHSDGALSLWEVANEAVRSGLDYLAMAEHNTVSHHPLLAEVGARQGITLIPAQEVTTHRGHANVYGDVGFIDFRRPAEDWAREARRRGGVMSINHPVSDDCAWLHPLPEGADAVELAHGSWYRALTDTGVLAWHGLWQRQHPGAAIVGGGDFHDRDLPLRPGMPTTWIAAEECSAEALIEGVRAGRTTVTASAHVLSSTEARPDLFGVPTLIRHGEDLLALDAAGTVLVDGAGAHQVIDTADRQRIRAPRERGPYRLEMPNRWIIAVCA